MEDASRFVRSTWELLEENFSPRLGFVVWIEKGVSTPKVGITANDEKSSKLSGDAIHPTRRQHGKPVCVLLSLHQMTRYAHSRKMPCCSRSSTPFHASAFGRPSYFTWQSASHQHEFRTTRHPSVSTKPFQDRKDNQPVDTHGIQHQPRTTPNPRVRHGWSNALAPPVGKPQHCMFNALAQR